jgi:hypothetical protein
VVRLRYSGGAAGTREERRKTQLPAPERQHPLARFAAAKHARALDPDLLRIETQLALGGLVYSRSVTSV